MGDNLEENWEIEQGGSEPEVDLVDDGSNGSEGEVGSGSEGEEEDKIATPEEESPRKGKKRPLPTSSSDSAPKKSVEKLAKKAAKLKELKARKKAKKEEDGASAGQDAALSKKTSGIGSSSEGDAALLWALCCKAMGQELTSVELLSPWVTPDDLAVVENFGQHSVAKMVGFIKASLPEWRDIVQRKNGVNVVAGRKLKGGSPPIIVVCSGARRCVEIIKALAAFHCQVLKLFAKHMDVKEQAIMCKRYFPIAVGTPARIVKLAEEGHLSFAHTQLLVLDMDQNVKGMGLMDMKGVANVACKLLQVHAKPHLASAGGAGLRVGVY